MAPARKKVADRTRASLMNRRREYVAPCPCDV
jgi:hypothetical protein